MIQFRWERRGGGARADSPAGNRVLQFLRPWARGPGATRLPEVGRLLTQDPGARGGSGGPKLVLQTNDAAGAAQNSSVKQLVEVGVAEAFRLNPFGVFDPNHPPCSQGQGPSRFPVGPITGLRKRAGISLRSIFGGHETGPGSS